MDIGTLSVGQKVYFGRAHGEKTLGKVVKVNAKSVKVEQLESRGTFKAHKVGTTWKVAPAFVFPAPQDAVPEETTLIFLDRKGDLTCKLPGDHVPAHPKGSRPESEILKDIAGLYCDLSPENLTCDGELSGSQIRAKAARINRDLKGLFAELGREVSEDEAWKHTG